MTAERLLIIDDDPQFGRLLVRVAESAGLEARHATDPETFRQLLREWHPAIVAVDLIMPGKDGIELLREIKSDHFDGIILLISGVDQRTLNSARLLADSLGLAVAETITKPIRAPELRQLLETLREDQDEVSSERLQHAAENNEFVLHYQPVYHAESGHMCGVEALVRWAHPNGAIIYPDDFIPLAERTKCIGVITEWVVDQAIKDLVAWQGAGLKLGLSVNISATNLDDLGLPDKIGRLADESGISADAITIELTETAATGDSTAVLDVLTRFRVKGFALSIDDFGTGYSSLVQLQRLPFSALKIDKSFVMGMEKPEDERSVIANTTILMGRGLGLTVTAEGVETELALSILKEFGCDRVQGFHLSRPVPADQIPALARAAGTPGVDAYDRPRLAKG